MLLAHEPSTHDTLLMLAVGLLILLVILAVAAIAIRVHTSKRFGRNQELLRSCILRIETDQLIEGARYRVVSVLTPLSADSDTPVTLILEAFTYLGSPVPELLVSMHLRPDTCQALRDLQAAMSPMYMEWKGGRPMFE